MTRSFRDQFSEYLFEQKTLRKETPYLLVLFGTALAVRLIGITYGLPVTYNSTEYFIAKHALSMGARHTLEPLYFIYPTLFTYLMAITYGMYFFAGLLGGRFHSPEDFALEFLIQPGNFYLLGRLVVAVIFILGLFYAYRALRLFLEPRSALFFTLMLLFSYNLQFYTFWMVPDALLFTGTLVVFYYILKWQKMGVRTREVLWAGLICGLTLSAKYNAGFLTLGLLGAVFLETQPRRGKPLLRHLAFAVGGIGLGFLLGTPYALLAFHRFREGFLTIWAQSEYDYNITTGLPYVWEMLEMVKTEWLWGLVLLLVFFWSIIRPQKKYWPFLLVVYPTFLIVGSWEKKGLDYLLIIFPLLTLQAGFIYAEHIKGRWPRRLVVGLAIALLLPSVLHVAYLKFRFTRTDTRQQATQWIVKHIPPESTLCYDHYHYDLNLIDIDRFAEYGAGSRFLSPTLKARLRQLEGLPNRYRLVSPRHRLNRPRWPTTADSIRHSRNPFLVEQFSHPFKSLKDLQEEGVQWLILNSETFQKYLLNPEPPENNPLRHLFVAKRQFYEAVFRNLQPIRVFRPDWKTPGPEIRIYRLSPANGENASP
ncbi:MAG: glycosyltransferase family 39 protein [Calditrichaeota bacterium]|nr:glycosyltransferase family 39 protein [Calditrichota bacterium]